MGGWLTPHPSRFTPGKETLYTFVQVDGWAPGPVWTGAENLALTGIRSPDLQPVASLYTDWAIVADHDINILM